jgi:anti-anti-sigma factor
MTTHALATSDPTSAAIDVNLQVVGHRTVLSVAGEIDMATAPRLAEALDAAVAAGAQDVWIDLTATGFMDSSGLHALIGIQRRLRALNRRLAVICPAGAVRHVLEVTGVEAWLPLFADRADAHRRT